MRFFEILDGRYPAWETVIETIDGKEKPAVKMLKSDFDDLIKEYKELYLTISVLRMENQKLLRKFDISLLEPQTNEVRYWKKPTKNTNEVTDPKMLEDMTTCWCDCGKLLTECKGAPHSNWSSTIGPWTPVNHNK